jgi:hypothetical protein
MKYRILSDEELSHLAEDFKHFLIVNGVHHDEWVKMNEEDKEKAIQLVEIFSDTVLDKVYDKIKYLEFQSKENCMVFYLGEKEIHLISLQGKPNSLVDFSNTEKIHGTLQNKPNEVQFFRSQKAYSKPRNEEVHQLITQGCIVSSESFWQSLIEVLK